MKRNSGAGVRLAGKDQVALHVGSKDHKKRAGAARSTLVTGSVIALAVVFEVGAYFACCRISK